MAANLIGELQMKNNLELRIYVACLAAYNSGYLHGAWIDASQDVDKIYADINKMLAASPIPHAEEIAIHDTEGFGDLIEEYTGIDRVVELATYIAKNNELGLAVLEHINCDIEEATKLLDECYHGEHKSEEEFAYYWTHEIDCREIPEYLQHYIDYNSMARDFFINDFFSIVIDHKVHVFSNY